LGGVPGKGGRAPGRVDLRRADDQERVQEGEGRLSGGRLEERKRASRTRRGSGSGARRRRATDDEVRARASRARVPPSCAASSAPPTPHSRTPSTCLPCVTTSRERRGGRGTTASERSG